MKRKISLFMILAVLFTALASPVYAAEVSNDFGFDLLDYRNVNNSGSNTFRFTGSVSNWISLPEPYLTSYIDVFFYATGSSMTGIETVWNGSTKSLLTIVSVGGGFYRAYGSIRVESYSRIDFNWYNNGSGVSYVTILSCIVRSGNQHFDTEAYCNIISYGYADTIHYVPTDIINYRQLPQVTNFKNAGYTLSVTVDTWRKYDYIDVTLYIAVDSVTSISCMFDGVDVPISVTYLDNDAMTVNSFYITIRMDVTGLNRNIDGVPVINITGNQYTSDVSSVHFVSCTGFVEYDSDFIWYRDLKRFIQAQFNNVSIWIVSQTDTMVGILEDFMTNVANSFVNLVNQLTVHFNNVKIWIQNQTDTLEAAIRGDTAPGDAFQDEVDEKDQQLNDMAAVMDSVVRPDNVELTVDGYIDLNDVGQAAEPLTVILTSDLFFPIFMMSFIMCTMGYLLYGKR